MATMQSLNCCQVLKMVYHPHLTIYGTGDPCESTLVDGRFPRDLSHLSRGYQPQREQ